MFSCSASVSVSAIDHQQRCLKSFCHQRLTIGRFLTVDVYHNIFVTYFGLDIYFEGVKSVDCSPASGCVCSSVILNTDEF
jgi:hypothetical protein